MLMLTNPVRNFASLFYYITIITFINKAKDSYIFIKSRYREDGHPQSFNYLHEALTKMMVLVFCKTMFIPVRIQYFVAIAAAPPWLVRYDRGAFYKAAKYYRVLLSHSRGDRVVIPACNNL